jgi:hypothetical protein
MLKRTRRRTGWLTAGGAALVLGAPALVQAQTQLFPLAPIQRQRVPCPMEDPVYGLYRHQYWGYFPTCWRRFPPGWGCPNCEAPDVAKAFQDLPREKPQPMTEPEEGGPGPLPGREPGGPAGRTPPPLPRDERSPFELPPANPPGAPGDATPAPTIPPTTRRNEPAPGGERGEKPAEGFAPLLALPAPVEPQPAPAPGTPTPGNSSALEPRSPVRPGALPGPMPAPSAAVAPIPALPDPALPRQTMAMIPPIPPIPDDPSAAAPSTTPVQAPRRRGPISTLFNGMTSFLRR